MKKWVTTFAIAAAAAFAALQGHTQEPEVLRPEAAFAYTLTADSAAITVHFDLVDGYNVLDNPVPPE